MVPHINVPEWWLEEEHDGWLDGLGPVALVEENLEDLFPVFARVLLVHRTRPAEHTHLHH